MQRAFVNLLIMLVQMSWGWAAEPADPSPPVYRYLILVETSAPMDRQRAVALDTVHELIMSGFYGRIQAGDVLGVWPFRDDVGAGLSRPIVWSRAEAGDLANYFYRKLRDLKFTKEPNLDAAVAAVMAEGRRSERLTVFLVTSGSQLVYGTPFDAEINEVFTQHGEAMRRAGKPFVTVLLFDQQQLVAHSITPGGLKIYIPPMPGAVAAELSAESDSEPAPVEPGPPADSVTELGPDGSEPRVAEPSPDKVDASATTGQRAAVVAPKPMTVEEISAKLRETQKSSTNTPPAVLPGAPGQVATAEGPGLVTMPAPPPALPGAPAIGKPPAAPPPPVETVERPEVRPGTAESAPPAAESRAEETEVEAGRLALLAGDVAPPDSAMVESNVVPARAKVAPALAVPPGQGREGRWMYLAAGSTLLFLALVIVWLRFRRPRRRARTSVISQSLNRR